MAYDVKDIMSKFDIISESAPYGEGHINDTFLAEVSSGKYILQRINHNIFKNPEELMDNVVLVTQYLQDFIKNRGGDPSRETLKVVKTTDGKNLYKSDDGNYFRVYHFVEDTITYQAVETLDQFYQSGKGFGRFQNDLSAFPADKLNETIEQFHDTANRFKNLVKAIDENKAGRKDSVQAEIDFALAREKDVSIVVDGIKNGEIPLRVTHNDTKLNNVLFDAESDKALCVIDLDTVMPGSLLYDFGDSIRFGASTGAEDEKDLSKIECSMELFEAFTKGFLEELKSSITPKEVELLAFGAKIMTYECGIRFLTDYLEGDTYFKIHRPEHNLDRCRTQFKLVADMEAKMEQMNAIVKKCMEG